MSKKLQNFISQFTTPLRKKKVKLRLNLPDDGDTLVFNIITYIDTFKVLANELTK